MPPQGKAQSVVFHMCCRHNHYAPEIVLQFRHQRRMLQNKEQLTPTEKLTVSTMNYNRIRAILGKDEKNNRRKSNGSQESCPNGSKFRGPIYARTAERNSHGLPRDIPRSGDGGI